LIDLFTKTNQLNHELSDRVNQLEDALAQSRQALQQELERAEAAETGERHAPSDTEAAQQVSYLLNQLEFAQQANQRQEILVETLTNQLEARQARLAQLEQETQEFQQTITQQSTQILEGDRRCRDLQARLQRQQQYTLQFKVALDKCLEVPPPSYETVPLGPEIGDGSPSIPTVSSQVSIPPISLAEGAIAPSQPFAQSTASPAVPPSGASSFEALLSGAASVDTASSDAASSSEPSLPDPGTAFQAPAPLVDGLVPKVDSIKPWSVETESTALPSPSPETPSDQEGDPAEGAAPTLDLFSARFNNTLRDLIHADVSQPTDVPSGEGQETPLGRSPNADPPPEHTADDRIRDDRNLAEPAAPSALNTESSVTLQSEGSPVSSEHSDVTPEQPQEPSWVKWRSFLPPDLRQLGDRDRLTPSASSTEQADDEGSVNSRSDQESVSAPSPQTDASGTSAKTSFSYAESLQSIDEDSMDDAPEESSEEASDSTFSDYSLRDVANLVSATADDIARAQFTDDPAGLNAHPPSPTSLSEIFEGSTDTDAQPGDAHFSSQLGSRESDDGSSANAPDTETSADLWTQPSGPSVTNSSVFGSTTSIPPFSVTTSSDRNPLLAIAQSSLVNGDDQPDIPPAPTTPASTTDDPQETSSAQSSVPPETPEVTPDRDDVADAVNDQTSAEPQPAGHPASPDADRAKPKSSLKDVSLYTPSGDRRPGQQRTTLTSLTFALSQPEKESKATPPPTAPSQAPSSEPPKAQPISVTQPAMPQPVWQKHAPDWPAPLLSSQKTQTQPDDNKESQDDSKKASDSKKAPTIDLPVFLR
jgi:hypothetical protein